MIEAQGLTKRYGSKTAVDDVTFTVHPGRVTGFLGPNGAGKSTTMRMIVGLDRPTHGTVTVNGRKYAQHRAPLREVGALLDAKAVHTGRSAYNHLLAMGATHGIGKSRVREVIEMTGLESVARKRVGGFSLGMGQRLGIASALLGDPHTLILDEPVNGLDPEGVVWVRNLVRFLAGQGRRLPVLTPHERDGPHRRPHHRRRPRTGTRGRTSGRHHRPRCRHDRTCVQLQREPARRAPGRPGGHHRLDCPAVARGDRQHGPGDW